MSESLSDKLKSLGVQIGPQNLPAPKPQKAEYPIEEVLAGEEIATPYGSVFQVAYHYPLDYQHGAVGLSTPIHPEKLGAWARATRLGSEGLDRILFLDTETSGLAGGTGTFAFLVGLGFRSAEGFNVLQLFMRDPGQEQAFLSALGVIANRFEHVVTFNGKSFDIPLLNTRHVLNGAATPFGQMAHVDLLPLARRLWRNRMSSRALKDLEIEILHVPRSQDEVPGWMIPEIYFDYLRSGDARPLAGVFYHNAMDILSLAALFNFCSDLLDQPLEIKEVPGLDLAAIARLFEEMEHIDLAVSVYEESLRKGDLPLQFYLETIQRFADLHRKKERWLEAVTLWKKAAEHRWVDAFIELAKFYEHHEKDYQAALVWTEQALVEIYQIQMPYWRQKVMADELMHRRSRLQKRIQSTTASKLEENHGS